MLNALLDTIKSFYPEEKWIQVPFADNYDDLLEDQKQPLNESKTPEVDSYGHDARKLYTQRWEAAKVTDTKQVEFILKRINQSKPRYEKATENIDMPWWFLACIHNMEASGDFNKNMLNGQPLKMVTTIVPKGYGPFKKWEDSVEVMYELKKKRLPASWEDIADVLFCLERYNGLGYLKLHPEVPSPYVWAGTSVYTSGKYVRDGKFDRNFVSKQIGCVPILRGIMGN
jgi:lysozyme family protein